MKQQLLWIGLAGTVSSCMHFQEPVIADRTPPSLSWATEQEHSSGVQGYAGHQVRINIGSNEAFTIYSKADDVGGLNQVTLTGLATLRCATSDGRWTAPFEVIRALPDATETNRITIGKPMQQHTILKQEVRVAGLSCGEFAVPGKRLPQELFALSGKIQFRAHAMDYSGRSAEIAMLVTARPVPRQLAAARRTVSPIQQFLADVPAQTLAER